MTPERFVTELEQVTRQGAAGTVAYLENPPVAQPLGHLGEFSDWFRGMSERDARRTRLAMLYAAEGALFEILNVSSA